MLLTLARTLVVPVVLLLAAKPAAPDADAPAAVDISAVKDKFVVLTDGKQHYVALVPFDSGWNHVYYGDGKMFSALRIGATRSEGTKEFSLTFWEPRVKRRYMADVGFKDGAYEVTCDERVTKMTALPKDEAAAMVAAARFTAPLWQYRAYALARDDRGTYYFVDRRREPDTSLDFRLYAGPRGQLKRLKMTNVVSDSGGEIFSTKTGELRLILDKREYVWIKGKTRTALTTLPVEDNAQLIYTDLGAYLGQRLGTPCDDL